MRCRSCHHENEKNAAFCSKCGMRIAVEPDSAGDTEENDDHFVAYVQEKLAKQYQIIRVLGRGGMAYVFEAVELDLDRRVALKVLPMEHTYTEDLVKRFKREAKLAAGLHHPHIIPIYSVGSNGRVHYFTMAFMDGGTLEERVQQGLYLDTTIEIIKQVASALDYAHRKKLIHRDIKAANIMFDEHGAAYVVDFGIAKATANTITATRSFFGTPHYMSPEQVVDEKIDGRADLYALGVLFYQMATGRYPFNGSEALAVMYQHVNEHPLSPSDIHSKIPLGISHIILKLLAKDPGERYQTGAELVDDLDLLGTIDSGSSRTLQDPSLKNPDIAKTIKVESGKEPPPARTIPPPEPKRPFFAKLANHMRGDKRSVAAVLLAGAALVVMIGLVLLLARNPTSPSNTSETDPPAAIPEEQVELTEDRADNTYSSEYETYLPNTDPEEAPPTENTESEPRQETLANPAENGLDAEPATLAPDPIASPVTEEPPTSDPLGPEVEPPLVETKKTPVKTETKPAPPKTEAKRVDVPRKKKLSPREARLARLKQLLTEMGMIYIPRGQFEMGSRSALNRDERPIHTLTISAFRIGRTEVTQKLWTSVMKSNPSCRKGDTLPVENVSWQDIQVFLKELNTLLNTSYRLPTEAEWEYACKQGSEEGDLDDFAWYAKNSANQPHPVGSLRPNRLGLVDMRGNVWEWCRDWYDKRYYRSSPNKDPDGPATAEARVIGGGGWDDRAGQCRCANRESLPPSEKHCGLGFRLVDPTPMPLPEPIPM